MEHDTVAVNGIDMHYAHAGAGPLILFLHGFPQCWYEFRHQLAEFSADHLAVAPDLRGYNLTSKPDDVHAYVTCELVQDIRELVAHLGHERLILAGHDVGGAVAWSFALHHPEMIEALIILDTPHPGPFDAALRTDPEQQAASRYMLAARRPDAAESFAADDFAAMRATFDAPFFTDADRAVYVESWRRPGALAAALRWFEAEGQGPPSPDGTPAHGNIVRHIQPWTVTAPTLVLYGARDPWIRPAAHRDLDRWVPDLMFIEVPGAGHWLPEQHPELVNTLIREHLARVRERSVAV